MPKPDVLRQVAPVLKKYWGYTALRPLQAEAIEAGLNGEDSLVVLPTGGGKSLCYQVPPMVAGRTDVVVSPLISLMKDQVDGLKAAGYEAAAIHSNLTEMERSDIARAMVAGKLRLVFVSPERLLTPWFISLMQRANVDSFAIDEAHCISQWGHDFRPEYRRLAELRQHFPKATIHAYTATATERVRKDIIEQLKLRKPRVLVGRFDRPNLSYRVLPRVNLDSQLVEAVRAHKDEAVIVYCISRADTERITDLLRSNGINAAAYHAGLDPRTRAKTQEAFAKEQLDVVVATVAFGMGIDRSNVRCVIHAAMPKSIEHYQQETGRAGRDGLEAECVLIHSRGDYRRWETVITRSAEEAGQPPELTAAQMALVGEMASFAASQTCRHKALSQYFGQTYESTNCQACDVCLTDAPAMENGGEIAREIVECVLALRASYGVGYVVDVLRGATNERIQSRRHDRLPQYGSMRSVAREELQRIVYQVVDVGLLERTTGERPVLSVTSEGRNLARGGSVEVKLRAPAPTASAATRSRARDDAGWRGVDEGLFEELRALRRQIADERSVPPFVVLNDAVLRDMARSRPTSIQGLSGIRGIGEQKMADLGARFVTAIAMYCKEHGLAAGQSAFVPLAPSENTSKGVAFRMFEQSRPLEEVARSTGRSRSTVVAYLEEYVGERRPESVSAWVN
ncbi:MAG TPA: DNA helicase RecQ, partial [Dehalococcoidia bacterium]|nr:DNA helicase RecQ [Dehalococcoidia bacterium]